MYKEGHTKYSLKYVINISIETIKYDPVMIASIIQYQIVLYRFNYNFLTLFACLLNSF